MHDAVISSLIYSQRHVIFKASTPTLAERRRQRRGGSLPTGEGIIFRRRAMGPLAIRARPARALGCYWPSCDPQADWRVRQGLGRAQGRASKTGARRGKKITDSRVMTASAAIKNKLRNYSSKYRGHRGGKGEGGWPPATTHPPRQASSTLSLVSLGVPALPRPDYALGVPLQGIVSGSRD